MSGTLVQEQELGATAACAPQSPVETPSKLDEETRRVLQDARRKLIEDGWVRGRAGNPSVGYCILGAVAWSNPGDTSMAYIGSVRALENALGLPSVILWNDAPGRTFDEVIALFDRVLAEGS